ncbi:MAG: hypothetical protein JXB39_15680, partial [Deltaproteobacteria bacterium]|nr:hypothetical protein [Deltaproteobacteria bacterium]
MRTPLLALAALLAADPPGAPTTAMPGSGVEDVAAPLPVLDALGTPPEGQAALSAWWTSALRLRLGDTAYRVSGDTFEDGVCSFTFDEGVFVPVMSGRAPVSERLVGVVFVGKGTARLSFPDRADAWAFANHMVLTAGADPADLAPVAHGEAPFETPIQQGMILSADPAILRLLYDLDPLGGGVVYREKPEAGVDAEYVVTESRGRIRARLAATNILPDRRRTLVDSGLDPVAMLREDRLLHEGLGVPGKDLRLVADFQTGTRFGVAAKEGRVVGPMAWDRWLTCFRDGDGQADTGFGSMAFSHGRDHHSDHHFQRFSGTLQDAPSSGRLEAVRADLEVIPRPANLFGNRIVARVASTLTLRAEGGPVRHLLLRLPAETVLPGTFRIRTLTTEDGRALPWVSLQAETARTAVGGSDVVGLVTGETAEGSDAAAGGGSSASEGGLGGPSAIASPSEAATQALGGTAEDRSVEGELFRSTPMRHEILALLPEPVPDRAEVRIRFDWDAEWQYANWSSEGRPLGPTTGLQRVLPDVLPDPGGTAWDFHMKAGVPPPGLRTLSLAASGDTVKEWNDYDGTGWRWVETEARGAVHPSVAVGMWREWNEQAAVGMPAVRVHLFPATMSALRAFPPEVRRVVSFLDRFLPDFPLQEVEALQLPSTFVQQALVGTLGDAAPGIVAVRSIKASEAGETSAVEAEDPNLGRTQVARGVAYQVFGQSLKPASARDAWLGRALPEAYAAFYVRAAVGRKDFDARMEGVRKNLEDPADRLRGRDALEVGDRPLSLTGATASSDVSVKRRNEYGLFVLSWMLRHRLGDEPFFRGLDWFAQRRAGTRITTEDLQAAMEAASGQDLDDFFDTWVHGGRIPRLGIEVRTEPDPDGVTLRGCVVSDVPFGILDVPVVVTDATGRRVVAGPVRVVDGRGPFEVTGLAP